MKNLNQVVLTGNLARDPDARITASQIPVTHFCIAVARPKRKDGTNGTDFINCTAWRGLANVCKDYLKKGKAVAVQGRLQIDSFEGKDGKKVKAPYVVVENMQLLYNKQPLESKVEELEPEAESLTAF